MARIPWHSLRRPIAQPRQREPIMEMLDILQNTEVINIEDNQRYVPVSCLLTDTVMADGSGKGPWVWYMRKLFSLTLC